MFTKSTENSFSCRKNHAFSEYELFFFGYDILSVQFCYLKSVMMFWNFSLFDFSFEDSEL